MAYRIAYGDKGRDVRRLQLFLQQNGHDLSPDGHFGPNTRNALTAYQRHRGLMPTGEVGMADRDALAAAGLVLLGPPIAGAQPGSQWPPRPDRPPQPTAALTKGLVGGFRFRHTPRPDNPEKIEILDGWVQANIVRIPIPELDGCLFAGGASYIVQTVGHISCHRLAAPKFQRLFAEWGAAGLIDRVITCEGVFNARLKRGASTASEANLSNHSWGTAIDINAHQNWLGNVPVGVGARGCVRELVGIANRLGFFWGGHYTSRPDGMHFELAEL